MSKKFTRLNRDASYGEEGIHGRCEKAVKCANCGESHKSTDKRCNMFQYNMELKKIIAENNISLREAEDISKIHNPIKLPRITNIRTWPKIDTNNKNSLIFEDTRIGGVAIFIKNNICVEKIRSIDAAVDEVDCVGMRIKNIEECEEVDILGIYRRPEPTAKKTWKNLLSSLKEEKNIVLTGDFNAHNVIWNCEDTDRNGEEI